MTNLRSPDKYMLSRRDFLKLASVGALGLADTARRLNNAFSWAAAVDTLLNLDSGISQRARKQKLEAAAAKSIGQPEILSSLIKFEALQTYANAKGLVLAEATLRQFIYSEGEILDITKLVPQSLRNYPDKLTNAWTSEAQVNMMTDSELRQKWAGYGLEAALWGIHSNRGVAAVTRPPREKLGLKLEQGQTFPLEISGPGAGPNQDSFYSLKAFSQWFMGKVRNSQQDNDGWRVEVADVHYQLTDRYDFAKESITEGYFVTGQQLHGADIIKFTDSWLPSLGIDKSRQWLSDHLGESKMLELERAEVIAVDDRDGFRLQAAELAKPVPIVAKWEFPRMDLRIPGEFLL